jgi:hypothetical protein
MQQQHMVWWQQRMVRAVLMRKEGKSGRKSVKPRYTILTKSL